MSGSIGDFPNRRRKEAARYFAWASDETKVEHIITTLRAGIAKIPEAGAARQLATGARTGPRGGKPGVGDAGYDQDSRGGARDSASIPQQSEWAVERAKIFFAEAVTPIEKTHSAALKADARLDEVNKTLDRRTTDLAASNRSLKHGIIRRKAVEEALKKSGGHSHRLLEESRRLHQYLRHLTYRILTAQEDKRKKISRDLQDEVAQTLLGINVRLLTLRKEAAANAKGFKKEIASTQRLVNKAGKTIKRFAREISRYYEA